MANNKTQPKKLRRRIDGVLLLDKPKGMSSNTALQIAKRLFNAAKAGHTGTLDPMATGLLPLCLGEATKFAGTLLNADKCYEAVICLGISTDSGDAEGQILEQRPVNVTPEQIDEVIKEFTGNILQVPPMYSALKRDGKPLYEYARQGIELERQPRPVTIHTLKVTALNDHLLSILVDCSKGTYIRTLAEDIGEALGCGGHLIALRRTRIASLHIEHALNLDALEALTQEARDALLAPVDSLLSPLKAVELDTAAAERFGHGQAVTSEANFEWLGEESGALVRVYCDGQFLGLGSYQPDGRIAPERVLVISPALPNSEQPE